MVQVDLGKRSPQRLTPKQRAFVEEYLRCWNASEAARRVGYAPCSARVRAHRLMANPAVAALIQERIAELAMGADEVLVRLAEQARAMQMKYLQSDGTVDLAKLLEDGKAHLIKGTKWDQRGSLVIEFHDTQRALELIGKHHRLFNDNLAMSVDLTKLTEGQLERIINGEDPLAVVAAPGQSGEGTPAPSGAPAEPTA